MDESENESQKPFAFWVAETFLPHDDEHGEQEALNGTQFLIILAVSGLVVVLLGVALRVSCL